MRSPSHRRSFAILASFALLISSSAGMARANDVQQLAPIYPAPTTEGGVAFDESSGLWFVELGSPPAVDGTPRAQLNREHNNFRAAARQAGLQFEERRSFTTLWNGLSVRINPSQLATLQRTPGVRAVYPVVTVSIPETTPASSPELMTALAMTGADVAQSEMGLTGAGVKVAVMDTGIDYDHPDLGEGRGNRVTHGFDFVGDDFNAADPDNDEPQPNDDPMDCNGHGTHVAGIVGADGGPDGEGALGVAPGVTFGAYKVFGCEGSTFADIMISAMEMALVDGMHVLNMSIGAAFQWPQYPTATASDRLVNRGMVVVASIGNSGAFGVYSAGAPGVGDKVIGVASFDNTHINALTFNVNPSGQQVPYLTLATADDPPTSGTSAEVVFVGRGCPVEPASGITEPDPYLADPANKVALIVRGDCTFQGKYQRAADAGAVGVVIHSHVTGLFAGGGVTTRDIFGIGISLADGQHIRSLLDDGETVTLTWTDERVNAVNPTGGLISSFSSYGLAPDLSLKPDIGAPGGLIRSTYPLALGGYATVSGTSMSAPHVAGAAALVLEGRPQLNPRDMRTVLQNSAEPKNWWGDPSLGFLDNVHRQGAGMLDVVGAIQTTTSITPSKLALGESEAGPATRTLSIRNSGSAAVTYDLSHSPALSTGGSTFAPSFFTGFATVAFSQTSVTVGAGATANVDVTITANPALADRSQYGGYLLATGDDGSLHRVPYAGFKGDYQSILVLNPEASEFGNPLLRGSLTFGDSEEVTFNPDNDEVAWVLVHLSHQVRELRMEIRDANTGRQWHRALDLQYVGRNSTATSFFALPWDGTTMRGRSGRTLNVPDGQYVIELKVLKALGDASNPAHWETWTSPVVTVDRS